MSAFMTPLGPDSSSSTDRRFPASFQELLTDLVGRFVQLSLVYPVSALPGSTLPIGRLLAVETDYVAVDHVIVDGVRLHSILALYIRTADVRSVAPVQLEQILIDLALALPPERGRSTT